MGASVCLHVRAFFLNHAASPLTSSLAELTPLARWVKRILCRVSVEALDRVSVREVLEDNLMCALCVSQATQNFATEWLWLSATAS
jgi:hypothetical protein